MTSSVFPCYQLHYLLLNHLSFSRSSSQLLRHSKLLHILLKLSHYLPSAPFHSNVGKYKHSAIYSSCQNYHSNLDEIPACLVFQSYDRVKGNYVSIFSGYSEHTLPLSYITIYFNPDLQTGRKHQENSEHLKSK